MIGFKDADWNFYWTFVNFQLSIKPVFALFHDIFFVQWGEPPRHSIHLFLLQHIFTAHCGQEISSLQSAILLDHAWSNSTGHQLGWKGGRSWQNQPYWQCDVPPFWLKRKTYQQRYWTPSLSRDKIFNLEKEKSKKQTSQTIQRQMTEGWMTSTANRHSNVAS